MSSLHRVALVYLGRRGGIARYTLELAHALQSECQLSCHFSAHNVLREEIDRLDCPIYFYPTYTGLRSFVTSTVAMSEPRRIARSLKNESADFILDTGSGPWGDLLCRMTGRVPWVRIVHDAVLHQGRWKMLFAIQRALFPVRCNALIGVSEFTAAALRLQYPAMPVIASRHGIICNSTTPDIEGIVARRKHFIFFGRIEPYKGISVLLDAFELASASDSELRLTICGSGVVSMQQRRKIERLGIELRNEWLSEDEIDMIFAKVGVVVLPYLTATQSGVAAIAMAKALPIIATNVGALPEQVLDGINGLVVSVADVIALRDAMVKIASQETIARDFAVGSLKLGQTSYGWKAIATNMINDLVNGIYASSLAV
ncbi:MAG TPA: glycosyltransferase family 4 protein [Terracidiphilus sp.]|nr:glycosyltransferase family 4 protein [Terracidiphilus sp.]